MVDLAFAYLYCRAEEYLCIPEGPEDPMPNLHLALLGPWQMHLGGQPVTHFPTTKVQALLAYLAVEAHSAHTRDALLGLFWAEYSAGSARQNLRKTLQRLRQLLPAAYLQATGQTLQFDPASDYHLDVTAFTGLVAPCRHGPPGSHLACSACIDRLQQAVALYRGDFLAHFFVEESPAFEEWLLLKREWLRREALGALEQLAAYHQHQEAYDRAYIVCLAAAGTRPSARRSPPAAHVDPGLAWPAQRSPGAV